MAPKVSIVMSVFNELRFVETTISSIVHQDFNDWELLIVLDTLDDTIINLVRQCSENEPRIRLFQNAENIGLTRSLNFAVAKASGLYIARIDADDVASPERIRIQSEFLDRNPEVSIVGSWARIINENGSVIGTIKTAVNNHDITRGLLFKNQLIHPSVMIRKDVFMNFGGYDERLKRSQDYDFWLRLRNKIQFHNLDSYLLDYRKHDSSITQKNNIQQRTAGLEMMSRYVIENKQNLSVKEKCITCLFFIKQFYKILRQTF